MFSFATTVAAAVRYCVIASHPFRRILNFQIYSVEFTWNALHLHDYMLSDWLRWQKALLKLRKQKIRLMKAHTDTHHRIDRCRAFNSSPHCATASAHGKYWLNFVALFWQPSNRRTRPSHTAYTVCERCTHKSFSEYINVVAVYRCIKVDRMVARKSIWFYSKFWQAQATHTLGSFVHRNDVFFPLWQWQCQQQQTMSARAKPNQTRIFMLGS